MLCPACSVILYERVTFDLVLLDIMLPKIRAGFPDKVLSIMCTYEAFCQVLF